MDLSKINDLKARVQKYPRNILDRFVLSKLYMDHRMWNDAIDESKEILKIQPDYLVVHIQLGYALIQTNQKQEAKRVLEKAKEFAIQQNHRGMIPEIEELLEQV